MFPEAMQYSSKMHCESKAKPKSHWVLLSKLPKKPQLAIIPSSKPDSEDLFMHKGPYKSDKDNWTIWIGMLAYITD